MIKFTCKQLQQRKIKINLSWLGHFCNTTVEELAFQDFPDGWRGVAAPKERVHESTILAIFLKKKNWTRLDKIEIKFKSVL